MLTFIELGDILTPIQRGTRLAETPDGAWTPSDRAGGTSMSANDSTDLQSVGTTDAIDDEKQPWEGTCGCDDSRFPCLQCWRNGRRGLPRYRRI